MKHRLKGTILVCAAAIASLGVAAAIVLGGTSSDPLISLRYLTDTFLPAQRAAIEQGAAAGLAPVYDVAAARLEAEVNDRLGRLSVRDPGMTTAQTYTTIPVKERDVFELQGGTSVVLTSGGAKVSAGALLDLTEGVRLVSGAALQVNRRYLTDGSARVSVAVTTALGGISVQGNYRLWPSAGRAMPFTDLKYSDWFYPAVQFAYDAGMMGGVSDTAFSPSGPMTRAMLATVLCRMEGSPAPTAAPGFTDVADDTWYTAAVGWAAEAGVVNGLGDGLFGPEQSVTREQLAVMLHRYAAYLALNRGEGAALAAFPDASAASSWAFEALGWSIRAGIITGRNTGVLDPGGTATRAEVATMLQRFAVWEAASGLQG